MALHDLECVDPGVQLPGVNQAPHDVVVQVPEAQSDTTQVLEPAVDRFHRAVGRPDVEVGEHVLASAPQCPSQLSQLFQTRR